MLDSIEHHYDSLEHEMLNDFFETAPTKQHCKWLHWNMRDANYGFEALENRLKALGGTPFHLDERNRYDLSRILVSIYGVGYIAHPRLEKLMQENKITVRDFLTGPEEANAFVAREFVKLHQSTLRKVDVLANIAERAHSGVLRTYASWWERHGHSVKAAAEWLKEHWLVGAFITLLGLVGALYKLLPLLSS